MKDFKIDEAVWREMARKSLDTMDSINAKWCQEELERIKAGIAADTNFDCSNCPLPCCDPKTAFLTELQALMKRYNATIDVDGDECALWLTIDIDGHAIEYVAYDYYTGKEKQTALTPDNIFDYEKE